MNSIKGDRAVDLVVSLNDLKKLQKNDSLETFELVPFVDQSKTLTKLSPKNKKRTFNDLPFYEGLLLKNREAFVLRFTWTRKLSIHCT
jgi:hypothetical protein